VEIAPEASTETPQTPGENAEFEAVAAERGGFEPPIAVYPRCRFSKPVHSTTLPSLRMFVIVTSSEFSATPRDSHYGVKLSILAIPNGGFWQQSRAISGNTFQIR